MTIFAIHESIALAHVCSLGGYYLTLLSLSIAAANDKLFIKKREALFDVITKAVNCVQNILFLKVIFSSRQRMV